MTKKNDDVNRDDLSWLTFASPENPLQSTSLQIHFMDRRRAPTGTPGAPIETVVDLPYEAISNGTCAASGRL